MANLEYNIEITPNTLFQTASVSKQFTAFAIFQLVQQGKLQLDDDIRKYLTWFPNFGNKIAVENLLYHTSGIRDHLKLVLISGKKSTDPISRQDAINVLSKQRNLNFQPGEDFGYSNSNYFLLSEIIKFVTERSFQDYIDSSVLALPQMNHSFIQGEDSNTIKDIAISYVKKDSSTFIPEIFRQSYAGSRGLISNVFDMTSWIRYFYSELALSDGVTELLRVKGKLGNGETLKYYAGGLVADTHRGWNRYAHAGVEAGYRSYVSVFPELKFGIVILGNAGDNNIINASGALTNLFVKEREPKLKFNPVQDSVATFAMDSTYLKGFAGSYIAKDGRIYRFIYKSQNLFLENSNITYRMRRVCADTVVLVDFPEFKYVFSQSLQIPIVKEICPYWNLKLEKFSVAVDSTTNLKEYTGRFYCKELNCSYDIILEKNKLMMKKKRAEDVVLTIVGQNDLISDKWWIGHLKFIRDEKYGIAGFYVNTDNVQDLKFDKVTR